MIPFLLIIHTHSPEVIETKKKIARTTQTPYYLKLSLTQEVPDTTVVSFVFDTSTNPNFLGAMTHLPGRVMRHKKTKSAFPAPLTALAKEPLPRQLHGR
jgi:hypothetical protein